MEDSRDTFITPETAHVDEVSSDNEHIAELDNTSLHDEKPALSKDTVDELQTYVAAIEGTLTKIRSLISGTGISMSDLSLDTDSIKARLEKAPPMPKEHVDENTKIIEGVFEGEFMIGANGNKYNVPQNYASKSKLVEGDLLKLIIGENGKFVYKQIAPIDRERIVGVLSRDPENGDYYVEVGHDVYKVLLASVTYFKGAPGDEVVLLKPKGTKSKWAAIENIVKAGS